MILLPITCRVHFYLNVFGGMFLKEDMDSSRKEGVKVFNTYFQVKIGVDEEEESL